MFSSIEEDLYPEVIKKCYWPLLNLAKKKYCIGIEISALTLKIINTIDPAWVKDLKHLLRAGLVELIGSGYSQIIGPLVPADVNMWNQNLGLEVYRRLLDSRPKIALVNEMAFSSGIVEHYINAGYEGIVMEWNNPYQYSETWEDAWRHSPQIALGSNNYQIPVIWADSIIFQKFQRYVHNQIDLNEYLEFCRTKPKDAYYPLYSNDVEIFDFRPGRYRTEETLKNQESEWERIAVLFDTLILEGHEFVAPSEVLMGLKHDNGGNLLRLESLEQPIPVKKQEKYNINRWALSGRADFKINTRCFEIYELMKQNSNQATSADWGELCYLWSSDFRTHITESRWSDYEKRLSRFAQVWRQKRSDNLSGIDKRKSNPYEAASVDISNQNVLIESRDVSLRLNPRRGNSIVDCTFKSLNNLHLFGTINHGYYNNISLGADFYTGHSVIAPSAKPKISDLELVQPEIISTKSGPIIKSSIETEGISLELEISMISQGIIIQKNITLPSRFVGTIHPMHLTLFPEVWDRDSLYFATKNGGNEFESFFVGKEPVRHRGAYSNLISSLHSLGSTSGELIIGDSQKNIRITHDQGIGAVLPGITYVPLEKSNFFCRITYSALETDETFKHNDSEQKINTFFRIIFEK
jgi:hypothetical protein